MKCFCGYEKAVGSKVLVETGFGSNETVSRQLFEDELHQLYTDFMEL